MTLSRLAKRVATVGAVRAVLAISLLLFAIRAALEFTPFGGFLAGITGHSSVGLLGWAVVDATRAERVYRMARGG